MATQLVKTDSPATAEGLRVVTDPTSENIAAYEDNRFYQGSIALPQTIDEAEAMYGFDLYDGRMIHESNLATPIKKIKNAALKGGMSVVPSHEAPAPEEKDGPEKAERQRKHDQAVECADFVRYCLSRLRLPGERIMDVLEEMLDCVYTGHRLAEINTEIATEGPYAGDRVLTSVRPKPRRNYAFVVRSLGGLQGIVAIIPGLAPYVRQGIVFDPKSTMNMIAPDKVMVFRFGGKNGDPRGQSVFRDCYDAWLRYQQNKVYTDRISAQFGNGRLRGTIDAQAEGSISPQAVANDLAKWMPGTGFCPPKGVTADVLYPTVDPTWFESRERICREEMMMPIIINVREILSATRGSEKDSGVAQDVGDDVSAALKEFAQASTESQLFYSLCLWKWGKEIADEFTPKAILGSSISPDFSKNVTALASAGYTIHPSQVIAAEKAAGIPVRAADWQQQDMERAKADAAMAGNAAQDPKSPQNQSSGQGRTFRRAGQPKAAA